MQTHHQNTPIPARIVIAIVFLTVSASISAADPIEVHVSTSGDDSHPGTKGEPVASLQRARDLARSKKQELPDRAVHVVIRGGVYRLDQPLELGEHDSGTAQAPTVYRSAGEEPPRLIGGRRIRGFRAVEDPTVLKRLPDRAQRKVVRVDLGARGITEFGERQPRGFGRGGTPPMELFFNGERMTVARYPNQGWLTIQELPDGKSGRTITYAGHRPDRWADSEDPWLFGYWYHGWADQFLPVQSIDPEKNQITLGQKHSYGLRKEQRFFAMNIFCELDRPGEWYLDRDQGVLYFWPPGPIENGEAIVSVLDRPLLILDGAEHLNVEGLFLEATRGSGIVVRDGRNVTIDGCTLRNVGQDGIRVRGGHNHRVDSCEVHHTGSAGITLNGGDRKTLDPSDHEAVNNHVHHFSRLRRTYQPAFQISGVGSRVAHNQIHHGPHMAIGFGGNEHRIEYNELHHVLLETDDAGAMYIGRDWTERGHLIRHNYLHHSGTPYAPDPPSTRRPHVVYEPLHRHGTNLIYLDDAASGITVIGNVLHDAGRALFIGGGRDNRFENNLVLGGHIGMWVDARGLGWASDHIARGGGWHMYEKLDRVNHDEPPYAERYPGLARILRDNPPAPEGNRIVSNIFIGTENWRELQGTDTDTIHFAKNLHRDASVLPPDVTVRQLRQVVERIATKRQPEMGFKPIPFGEIGNP